MVRDLVTLHGGRVWVEDAPGGGARFVVELPNGEPSYGGRSYGDLPNGDLPHGDLPNGDAADVAEARR